jgi:hypothetical protein
MTYIEGQGQFPMAIKKERLIFPIELRRESPYKIVSRTDEETLAQLDLDMKSLYANDLNTNSQPDLFKRVSDEFQDLCDSLSWQKEKLPAKTRVNFKGITYGYYCITHPGKFVIAKMENPNNPGQELTIVLSKSAFKKPTETRHAKPRKLTRKAALGKALEYQTKTAPKETARDIEKIPMTKITIYPGVRLFIFEGDPKTRLEGQTDEQREGVLNNLKPIVVEQKVKMIVPGKNPLDAYKHTEGTFFRGKIDGREYWATIGDVKNFAEIARQRDHYHPKNSA